MSLHVNVTLLCLLALQVGPVFLGAQTSLCDGFTPQASYTGDCFYRPYASVCVKYSDWFVWLIFPQSGVETWGQVACPSGTAEYALAGGSAYYHILGTNLVKTAPATSDRTPPFGSFDTPGNNATGLVGAIPATGWTLDNTQVARVEIWRNPVAGEAAAGNGLVYIGKGTFVDGARPDVAAIYLQYPYRTRAGWGLQLLTNMLPNRGNGTYALHAFAYDLAGNGTLLGSRTITCANATAAKPFGTIDTPGQGETISGRAFLNWGWALTPQPYTIPTDGSTIWVFVDGQPFGHPYYGLYRPDVASLFPGLANTNGAIGYYVLDTTRLANGMHTIEWSVVDTGGRVEGIGSRVFWVNNATPTAVGIRAVETGGH